MAEKQIELFELTHLPGTEKEGAIMKKEHWLELATSDLEERPALRKVHECVAADGIRMHIDNRGNPCDCGDNKQHQAIDRVINGVKEIPFAFAINKNFLFDALNGINPDGSYVLFFVKDAKSPIVIQDPDGTETAIIMPLNDMSVPKPQNLPQVTPMPVEKLSRYDLFAEVE
jgi:hypothetical protein